MISSSFLGITSFSSRIRTAFFHRPGVSTSTASRALSGHGYVSAEARQRIETAVFALGYVPDINARNLRLGAVECV